MTIPAREALEAALRLLEELERAVAADPEAWQLARNIGALIEEVLDENNPPEATPALPSGVWAA